MSQISPNRLQRVHQPFELKMGRRSGGKTSFISLVAVAVVVALVASWGETIIVAETSGNDLLSQESRPSEYYLFHGLAILSVMGAGLLCLLNGRLRPLRPSTRFSLAVLFFTAAAWSLTSYTWGEIFSPVIFGATGPFVWFTLLFMLAGTDPNIWKAADLTIQTLAYLSTVLGLRALLTSSGFVYGIGSSKYIIYVTVLAWLGGWTLLTAVQKRGWRLCLRTIPFFTFVLLAIYSQTRSWIILSMILGCFFFRLRFNEGHSIRAAMVVVAGGLAVAVAAGITFYAVAPQQMQSAMDGLTDRLYDDTRSGQYDDFAADVALSDLLFGRGPKGTWYWTVMGDYQFFDNGYLWMLFIGGVPTLLSYCAIIVWPAIQALWRRPRGPDGAAVFLVLTWGIALTGLSTFTIPSVSLHSYLIALWAGRCHALVVERGATQAAVWHGLQSPGALGSPRGIQERAACSLSYPAR